MLHCKHSSLHLYINHTKSFSLYLEVLQTLFLLENLFFSRLCSKPSSFLVELEGLLFFEVIMKILSPFLLSF
jgi:hypothetical protein